MKKNICSIEGVSLFFYKKYDEITLLKNNCLYQQNIITGRCHKKNLKNPISYLQEFEYELSIILYNDFESYKKALLLTNYIENTNIRLCHEIHYAAVGTLNNFYNEYYLSYSYKKNNTNIEIGGGVLEIQGECAQENTIQIAVENIDDYMYDILAGCNLLTKIIYHDKSIPDLVILDCIPFSISIGTLQNQTVRNYITIIEKNSTIPCCESREIYIDDSILFIEISGNRIIIPQYLYSQINDCTLKIDINYHKIKINLLKEKTPPIEIYLANVI